MTSYGPNHDHFRDALSRLSRCRWMRPDAELESLTPAALTWLAERVDELHAALLPFTPTPDALSALSLSTERSARAAFERCNSTWETHAPSPVIEALYEAVRHVDQTLGRTLSTDERRALDREISEALGATCGAPSPWAEEIARHERSSVKRGRPVVPRGPGQHHPGAAVAEKQLLWNVAFGDDARAPSPWAPFAAMFERGAWPMLLPDATVLVYVPVLHGGRLVPEPAKPLKNSVFPKREPRRAPTPRTIPPIEKLGVSTPPGHLEYGFATMRMGRIAAVRPTPREPPQPPVKPPRRDDDR